MLILTEKPSVSAAFAQALGVPRKEGFWENGEYCIVNAIGHLLENYAPQDYDPAFKKWALETLPIIPEIIQYKPVAATEKQLAVVKKCFDAHKGKPLLLATDAEREGELIGAEILEYVGFSGYENAKRFWVSQALTPEVILEGIRNAKPLCEYASYREQGYARQQADWIAGINLSRLVSLKSGKTLPVGRVQTAVLGAVYERDTSIANFKPEPFVEIKAMLKSEAGSFSVKLLNENNSEFPFRFPPGTNVETAGVTGNIAEVKKETKTLQPPKLFNLTALQKKAHTKYAYSPEKTLELAQALYEKHKCLSYPRTPSTVMGDDNVGLVKTIYETLKDIPGCGDITKGCDPALIDASNKRIFNSEKLVDHHALVPLEPIPEGAAQDERNVYSLVFENFFTALKPPCVYNSVKITVAINGKTFAGNGTEILEAGWKTQSAENDDEESAEESQDYSGLKEGDRCQVESIVKEEKATEPKKRFTFTSLLQLMENPRDGESKRLTGLGTPATRGAILQKLVDRKFIVVKGKTIQAAPDGDFLIANILKNDALSAFISIPETTKWEDQLHENTAAFLEGIKDFVRNAVAATSIDAYVREKESLGKCPSCKGEIHEGTKNYYCGNYKAQTPCKFVIWKTMSGAQLSPLDAKALLAGKKTKPKKFVSKNTGNEFSASLFLKGGDVAFFFEDKKK